MKRESSRANALLVELLLVIFFFMISAAILVQLFADARHRSIQARAATAAIVEAQNCAEDLYAAEDGEGWEKYLNKYFTRDGSDTWSRQYEGGFTLKITKEFTEKEGGVIHQFNIVGQGDGKDLFTLPATRYVPAPADGKEGGQ